MAPIPTPFRAALGLAASAVESARTLPDRALELPVLAVSTALQFSLRAQQRYAELTLRGDELLGRLHGPPEEPPPWATFDDDGSAGAGRADERRADDGGANGDGAGSDDEAPDREVRDTAPPEDIPIDEPAQRAAPHPVKSAAKQPRKTNARTAKAGAAKQSGAKRVRSPRQAKPSAFDDAPGGPDA